MPSKVQPDGVIVGSVSSLPTCDSSIAGKMVFNTGDNTLYYCDGTNWNACTGGGTCTSTETASAEFSASDKPSSYFTTSDGISELHASSTTGTIASYTVDLDKDGIIIVVFGIAFRMSVYSGYTQSATVEIDVDGSSVASETTTINNTLSVNLIVYDKVSTRHIGSYAAGSHSVDLKVSASTSILYWPIIEVVSVEPS